jgi:SPP1 gp7 family putative phage head morphogenesis protein
MSLVIAERKKMLFGNKKPSKRRVKWLYPNTVVRQYTAYLFLIIDELYKKMDSFLYGNLLQIITERVSERIRLDSAQSNLDRFLEALKITLSGRKDPDLKLMAQDIGQRTSRWNDKEWQKTVKAIMGVNVLLREPWLRDRIDGFASENAHLVKSMSDKFTSDIESTIRRGFSRGLRHEDVMDDLRGLLNVTKTRARLIARDQISKLNGDLTKERQTSVGIEMYTWETSDDERVREKTKSTLSHRALDGKLCRWDDSSVYSDDGGKTWVSRDAIGAFVGIPGEDIQCRCWAKPVFEE